MPTHLVIQLVKDLFPDQPAGPRRRRQVNVSQAIVFYELFGDWNAVGRIMGFQARGVWKAVRRFDRCIR